MQIIILIFPIVLFKSFDGLQRALDAAFDIAAIELERSKPHEQLRVLQGLVLITLHIGLRLHEVVKGLFLMPDLQLPLPQLIVLRSRYLRLISAHSNAFAEGLLHEVDALLPVPKTSIEIREQLIQLAVVQMIFLQPEISYL
jgi:hypothetical protein